MTHKSPPIDQIRADIAAGIRRISLNFVRLIPRAARGSFAICHDLRYCPALNSDSKWLWGAFVTESPNPFRGIAP